MFKVAILIASDKGSRGDREDVSGTVIEEFLSQQGYTLAEKIIIPDERHLIADHLIRFCDEEKYDLVFTSGGTGFSPRDWTPEATLDVIQRQVPGIPEAMRAASLVITPRAMLSRAVAGIRKNTLIINLPGSPKAVKENLAVLVPTLDHGLEILTGKAQECAQK